MDQPLEEEADLLKWPLELTSQGDETSDWRVYIQTVQRTVILWTKDFWDGCWITKSGFPVRLARAAKRAKKWLAILVAKAESSSVWESQVNGKLEELDIQSFSKKTSARVQTPACSFLFLFTGGRKKLIHSGKITGRECIKIGLRQPNTITL